MHPAILDAAVHTAVHPMITGYKVGTRYYLPSHFRELDAHEALDQRPFPKTVYSHLTLVESTPGASVPSLLRVASLIIAIFQFP